jgi:hypothetical protein
VRGDRLRELFALFALTPGEERTDEGDEEDPLRALPDEREGVSREQRQREARRNGPVFFRTIVGLPLPKSGNFENVPPEVVAAALGKVIHLLHCLVKYLKITYPHPREFNGSFSTIGNTSEGTGCHTLYPDGSVGFERGVGLLHENVAFLCACQGVPRSEVHPTDLLGTLCDNQEAKDVDPNQRYVAICFRPWPRELRQSCCPCSANAADASVLLENSQMLEESIEILPHYS